MKLQGAGAIVTGAGTGIGRAMAMTVADHGARVVVSDLDVRATHELTDEIDGVAVPWDLGASDFPAQLVESARAELDFIDPFFSNAGVDIGPGPDAGDPAWTTALEVNLLSEDA